MMTNQRTVHTPVGQVVIKKKPLRHVVLNRAAQGERYVNCILPTLTDPNEIWLIEYSDGSLRYRFFKFFRSKRHMLVIVKQNINSNLFWNAIAAKARYMDYQRTGVLLYLKEK